MDRVPVVLDHLRADVAFERFRLGLTLILISLSYVETNINRSDVLDLQHVVAKRILIVRWTDF